MANKKCMVFETMNNVQGMQIVESKETNTIRLHGVFGVAGVKNNNNRIYSKENYGLMVENLQNVIANEGCLGELEHPQSMNIDLNNVSHKIESIEMNEDGTVTGTIVLLNTDKGKNAKAIVEAGVPLYISSRAAGSIDESGNVTLTTLKTYDLVGTPGFSQAKLNLAENQTFESLNESLCVIYESDDLLGDDDSDDDEKKDKKKKKKDKKKDDSSDDLLGDDDSDDKKKDDDKDDSDDSDDLLGSDDDSDDKKDDKDDSDDSDSDDKKDKSEDKKKDKKEKKDNKNNDDKVNMKELKTAIDALTDRIENLEADLHIAKESLVNYEAIEKWVCEEFATEFKEEILESVEESINDATEQIAEGVQNWTINEFAPVLESYITEEFAPEVQNWVCEEFAPEVQNWVCEEFAPTIEGWINEELMPTVDAWINEECLPEHKENIVNEVNSNVSAFLESQKSDRFEDIDRMLEALDNQTVSNVDDALTILKENQAKNDAFRGVYVVENMPAQYKPQWEMLDEAKKNEVILMSRAYDFTKGGVLESFWASVDFNEKSEVVTENKDVMSNYHNNIFAQMMRLRH